MTKKINVMETFQESFRLFFKNILLLEIFILPILLGLFFFFLSLAMILMLGENTHPSISELALSFFIISIPAIIGLFFSMWGVGGIILSVENIEKGKKVEFWKGIDNAVKKTWRLMIAFSLEQLFLTLGLLLFIIPGIFFAVRLSLVVPGCILEKKGYGIKRSWNSTKGNFWKIFLILVIWNAGFIIIGSLPYVSIISILLLPVYLTTLTILYMRLRKR